MFRSLRGRLTVLLVLLVAAALAAGALMFGLFRQSATAQAGQAEAEIGRACDAISNAFRFYSAGWNGPASDHIRQTHPCRYNPSRMQLRRSRLPQL
jgi:hypothetical protein